MLACPAAFGTDTLISTVDHRLGDHLENLTLVGEAERATGNDRANVLAGSAASNRLFGLGGDDVVHGAAGADYLDGGAGSDILNVGADVETLTGGAGADRFVFVFGESRAPGNAPDQIRISAQGKGDQIDLSLLNGTLTFVGTAAFAGHAGEVRVDVLDGVAFVRVDADGDGLGDLAIRLAGEISLRAEDFLL